MSNRRNPVIRTATILRKGGPHEKTTSAKRQAIRQQLDDDILDYFEERQASQASANRKQQPAVKIDKGTTNDRPLKIPASICHTLSLTSSYTFSLRS